MRELKDLCQDGVKKISSSQLGEAVGITDAQVRKDLAHLGNLGQPGIGYATDELIAAIHRALGIDREWKVALVGVGNLARALLRPTTAFNNRVSRLWPCSTRIRPRSARSWRGSSCTIRTMLQRSYPPPAQELAILTVPSESAQAVTDALGTAGIRGILNFAPAVLRLPPAVSLVSVDLAVQLEQLAFLVQMGHGN